MNANRGAWRKRAGTRGASAAASWATTLCAGMLVLAGCHRAAPSGAAQAGASEAKGRETPEAGVTLSADEVQRLGIRATTLAAAQHAPESSGFAVVVTRDAIAQAVAELTTAAAVERQSRAARARGRSLAGTPGAISIETQEAAERQAAVDHAALVLAERRLSATYGRDAPWKNNYQSAALARLASGEAKLARVTFPLGTLGTAVPATLRLSHLGEVQGGKSFETSTVWSAPADASLPGRSFFALLRGSDAGEGERLLARAPTGAPQNGVVVPAAAVLISADKYWCYIEQKPGVFIRTAIDPGTPTDTGYFVSTGIAPGARVVTTSAGQLLAHELGTAAAD